MKALVYLGPAKKALEERPKPKISAPTGAIVRITKTTICGTDLRILKGDVPSCQPDRILGHEGAVLITGPANAKTELVKHIHHHDPALIDILAGVETVDHPSDGVLVAHAKHYFKAADLMQPQLP